AGGGQPDHELYCRALPQRLRGRHGQLGLAARVAPVPAAGISAVRHEHRGGAGKERGVKCLAGVGPRDVAGGEGRRGRRPARPGRPGRPVFRVSGGRRWREYIAVQGRSPYVLDRVAEMVSTSVISTSLTEATSRASHSTTGTPGSRSSAART